MKKTTTRWSGFINSRTLLAFVYTGFLTVMSLGTAIAADLPGAKDHPLLKRFSGSDTRAGSDQRSISG